MSLRSKLLSEVLRRVAKSAGDRPNSNSVAELRENLEASVRHAPKAPGFVDIRPVDAGGVPAEWVSVPGSRSSHVVLYLHGGSYISGSPRSHRNLTWRVAEAARARVLALDYRLAPEHPFPAGMNDVVTAYAWLLQQGVTRCAWCGDSAGGGLLFSALRGAHAANLPMPRAAVAFSPWTDLAGAGRSWTENA